MIRFIISLDGTITTNDVLLKTAERFNVESDIKTIMSQKMLGNIPFVESFIKQVHLMSALPIDEVDAYIEGVQLYSKIHMFISEHLDQCVVTTESLDCWVNRLSKKIGCEFFSSKAVVDNNKVKKIETILRKENIVKKYQSLGDVVVYVGDGNDDLEAMRQADISIASGLKHLPSNYVLGITDYVVFEEGALCRQLIQLL